MLILQNISYILPDKELLFDEIDLAVNEHEKIALTGNNGTGKSTLLRIVAGELQPSGGQITSSTRPYYVPQVFGQFNHLTVAQALRVDDKLSALHQILEGEVTQLNLDRLGDDWSVEERCNEALNHWQLTGIDLQQKMGTLSGGQKTKVFLAGISIHKPQLILLDEPSNHLDAAGRQLLYHFIRSTAASLVVVSHDRKLLNLLDTVCELSNRGLSVYGGNYDFYAEQKEAETEALYSDLKSKEKALRKAKETERKTRERQQKLDARGKQKQEKAGVARIMMNTLKNKAENSTSKLNAVHAEKIAGISHELSELRSALPGSDKMKLGFNNAALHNGKILVNGGRINCRYGDQWLWKEHLDLEIKSGERIAIKGLNGSGKTTLIRLVMGEQEPDHGSINRFFKHSVYIDQDYSLIDPRLTVYEQVQRFNTSGLQEHELKIRLARFLFTKDDWDKPSQVLSGGEKMRLMLCCFVTGEQMPDMIILDEPTNNLDLRNMQILTDAINEYRGTLIVVSHDEDFLEQVRTERSVIL